VESGHVVFEICNRRDTQTDMLNAILCDPPSSVILQLPLSRFTHRLVVKCKWTEIRQSLGSLISRDVKWLIFSFSVSQTRAKDVLRNINRTQAAEITRLPAATEWCRLLLHDVICNKHVPFCCCRGLWECTARFLSLVTLTFDLDIQTCPSKEPNTSSV